MGASRSFERTLPAHSMLLVHRPEFDRYLVAEAERLGGGSVEVRQQSPVVDLEEDSDLVRIRTGEGRLHAARTVIAADGARGDVRRLLGGRRPVQGVAMEWNVDLAGRHVAELGDFLTFDFGALEAGYGWSFPRNSVSLNIGVIDWSASGGMPARLHEFTGSLLKNGAGEGARPSGFPIPYFDGDYRQASNRICFAGDAAGLVDGVSGEGIRFALASGALAARWVLERLQPGGDGALSEGYLDALRQHCGGSWKLEQVRRFVRLPFLQRPEYFFDRVLKPAEFPFYWS
jgi:flavin-dependent dehydrogenase